jgi:hypothetical protein
MVQSAFTLLPAILYTTLSNINEAVKHYDTVLKLLITAVGHVTMLTLNLLRVLMTFFVNLPLASLTQQ